MQMHTCTENVFNIKGYIYIYVKYMKYIYLLRMLCTLLVKWEPRYVMDVLLASCSCSYQETVEIWVKLATWG